MNRRQKIIVSITGIFIILLVLVGLTYAYFLTRIRGNTKDKSISVTTANLILEYADGNGRIAPTEKIYPGYIKTKTFSATNKGNSEVDYIVVLEDVVNEISRIPDLVYTLTCGVYSKSDINANGTLKEGATKIGNCNGITETYFPKTTDLEIVVRNSLETDYANYYELTVHYKEADADQSVDMNKTFEAHVNIKDPNEYNPYKSDKDSLAYNIINNSITGSNGTKFRTTTLSKVAEEINIYSLGISESIPLSEIAELSYEWWDEQDEKRYYDCSDTMIGDKITDLYGYFDGSYLVTGCNGDEPIVEAPLRAIESSLSLTDDTYTEDTGIKSYYYRGNIQDNYVTFSNKCWRIVRIQGDGSIKLTLEDGSPCSESTKSDGGVGASMWGYDIDINRNRIGNYTDRFGLKSDLTTWFNATNSDGQRINITINAEKLLKTEEWCLGNVTNTYGHNSPYTILGTTAYENHAANINFYYETYRNLYGKGITPNATLICKGEIDSSKIGTLTADEVVFAGGKVKTSNHNYYLLTADDWWTISRAYFLGQYEKHEGAFLVTNYGSVINEFAEYNSRVDEFDNDVYFNARPAISLKTNTKIISGEGTKGNPYTIDES